MTQAGYVTDIAYIAGYYPFQSPYHLALACLLRSVEPPSIGPGLSYVELGCGRGHTALVLAASNPDWQVTALDFHPGHIAEARALAREAGIGNARFIEADFADPETIGAVPEADIVTLHGVWSWVPAAARRGIVALLRARLRAGGLAQVSFNSLPGWQGALGMQKLLREAGLRAAARSDRQARAGVETVRALAEAEAGHLRDGKIVRLTLDQVGRLPDEYVAHEYMNASWAPCFHADVCADLAPARLEWAASAHVIDSFLDLCVTPAQRAIIDRYEEPVMRELARDLCQDRLLRNDIFVRGTRRMGPDERDRRIGALRLALAKPADMFDYEVTVPVGRADLRRPFYEPVVAALAGGPADVGALQEAPGVGGERDNPAEIAGMLVGSHQAIPVGPAGRPSLAEDALAVAMGVRLEAEGALNARAALASGALRTGLPVSVVELAARRRLLAGETVEPGRLAETLLPRGDAEERARMAGAIEGVLTRSVPLWRRLGLSG